MKPVLFLHGFLGDSEDCNALRKRLQGLESKLRFFAPTLPAHDEHHPSIELLDGRPEAWSHWLRAEVVRVLEVTGEDSLHLVAYSLGGRLALNSVCDSIQGIRSLTLLSSSPGLDGALVRRERLELDRQRAEMLRGSGLQTFLKGWYELPLFKNLRDTQGLRILVDRRSVGREESATKALATLLENLSPGRWPSNWSRLSQLSIPLHYMVGELDSAYRTQAERLKEMTCTNHTVSVVPSVGHAMHLEAPEKCAELMQKFWIEIGEWR
jgi:2-succinyl-6-hydroxy-2,4-cyclohexadiene-1-carboxylate synthase